MQWKRKVFSQGEYDKRNRDAFEFLKRDILSSSSYYPVLRDEDFDIDVALYASKAAYRRHEKPLAFIELEIKAEKCYEWEKGAYPFPDIHFLYRKMHLMHQPAIAFWTCYNSTGTDCVTVPMEAIPSYPMGANTSQHEDLVVTVPIEACVFGGENIIATIEQYVREQMMIGEKLFQTAPEFYFANANKAYQKRHKYVETHDVQRRLTMRQKKNLPTVGIKTYL